MNDIVDKPQEHRKGALGRNYAERNNPWVQSEHK